MNTVLRREEKYALHYGEALSFANRFDQVMARDKHSQHGSYTVRSLYFDTINDKDFFDKINEQELRRKIRLRIYDPSDQRAKLEIKQKQNTFQKKRTMFISREDAYELIAGNNSVLLKYDKDLSNEIYSLMCMECYKPKTIVEYQRKAFMAKENDIRITFDTNIRASESNYDLFSENLSLIPVIDEEYSVVEVKYNRFMLSYIADIIATIDRRTSSISKYCYGRSVGYPFYL